MNIYKKIKFRIKKESIKYYFNSTADILEIFTINF